MGTYVPNTKPEQEAMLKEIGFDSFEALFAHIPDQVKLKEKLHIPEGASELEVYRELEGLANKNHVFTDIYRGAGAYNHYIPSIVNTIVNKEEFLTAYTPYQAEISQGILQSIFEYQTMICQLTGMSTSNASVYDGASAAAEACGMCCERKRNTIYVSETVNPSTLSVIRTYSFGRNQDVVVVPAKDGVTDESALQEMLSDTAGCFIMQQPNYFGIMEDADAMCEVTHTAGAKFIMSCNPIALATMKTPGEIGADVAVGEGQPLGLGLAFGGPYLGFMAATDKMTRKLPGRIVGETVDNQGQRGYVLTLQAREQHIRREKASSNICSNEALCALTAAVYLGAVGARGLVEVSKQCTSKAHYLQGKLEEAGCKLVYNQPFFHEFVTSCTSAHKVLSALQDKGILGGLPLSDTEILWCTTELNTKESMDQVAAIVKEVC